MLKTLDLSDNAWVYRGLDNLRPDGKGFAHELALGLSGQPTGALLKNLNISGNQIPRETMNDIIPLCKDSPKMQVLCGVPFNNMSETHLDVSGKHLDVEGAFVVIDYLQANDHLTELNASNNDMFKSYDKCTIEAWTDVLTDNSTLTNLNLANNKMVESDAKTLADGLSTNRVLTSLNISGNDLFYDDPRNQAGKALSDMLKKNKTLQYLDISNCIIIESASLDTSNSDYATGIYFAEAFADCLLTNDTLTHLNIRANRMDDAGARALAGCLRANDALTHLDISDNHIQAEGALAFADVLTPQKVCENGQLFEERILTVSYTHLRAHETGRIGGWGGGG